MKLSDYLSSRNILMDLAARGKSDVFTVMVDNLVKHGLGVEGGEAIPQGQESQGVQTMSGYTREEVLAVLEDRESLMSTGVSHWLGMPHGRLKGLSGEVVSLGISRRGIDYGALDHEPVHVVVMVLSPEDQPMLHVKVLSEIARIFSSERFLRMICDAESADEVIELIKSEEQ